MKIFIGLFFLFSNLTVIAQNISKAEFENGEWFANNDNEDFYKSDTISLTKILSYETDFKTLSKAHVIFYYNKNRPVETFVFGKKNKLCISQITDSFCGILGTLENWKWSFDNSTQVLKFYSDKNSIMEFKIIEISKGKEEWEFEVDKGKMTEFKADIQEIKVVRIKQ